jgi:ABC-type multidrug transport system permease subunit
VPQELNPEMLFSGMNNVPETVRTETWRQRYQASRYQKEFVANRSGKQPESQDKTGEESPRRQFGLQQLLALIKRNFYVKMGDRTQTAVLLAQAPLFAVLVVLVNYPLKAVTAAAHDFGDLAMKLPIIHFLMVVAAVWFGCNNAAREIVGEWTIYKRERMVTLKLSSYILSKFTILLGLCIFQCGTLLAIVYLVCGLHSNFFYDFVVLMLAAMIGVGMGLCISALCKTTESAIALLPVVLLPIIALGGGMRPIFEMPKAGQVLSLIIPSRWAFEANLLHEAGEAKWGPEKPAPDVTCALEPDKTAVDNAQGAAPMNPGLMSPWLTIVGDSAEVNIPRYTITAKDANGDQQTCRALAGEQYPQAAPKAHAVGYRHSFGESLGVLGGMLALLVGGVMAILLKRDNDPQ